MAKKLGISKEQVGGNTVSIPAPVKLKEHNPQYPTGYVFPLAKLSSVYFDAEKKMKDSTGVETTKPVLVFIFKDSKGRQVTHIEFPIEDDDIKFESKLDWMNQRVRHIWDETIGSSRFPENGIGAEAESFDQLFKELADAFNKEVAELDGKSVKVYSIPQLYVKLIYNRDRLNFPLFPNFLQKAEVAGKVVSCDMLTISGRDTIEPTAKPAAYNPGGDTGNAFGGDPSAAGYQFPDV